MSVPVTIAVLNHERRDLLRDAVRHALAQEWPDLEVLVVDNASTDGSADMVEREFPGVRLVRLPRNVGCAARNEGVAAARGDIVVTVDNDVRLLGSDAVARAVAALQADPRLACVNFKILGADGNVSRRDWCHPRAWEQFADERFPTDYVLEGASAFRRSAFLEVGGYWPPFFLGHEGLDLALRLADAGYGLLYTPEVQVRHLVSEEARPSSRIYYTYVRNGIWVALRRHRLGPAAASIAKDLALMGFAAARGGQIGAYVRGVVDAVKGAPAALRSRRALRRETYRRLREVRAQAPPLLQKVRRHLRERLI